MKKILSSCLAGLLLISVLGFMGCEAGLSQGNSSDDSDGFSFSDMYATIASLQSKITVLEKLVPPTGSITPFAGLMDKIPEGWLFCDGRPVSRSEYSALFDAIGTS